MKRDDAEFRSRSGLDDNRDDIRLPITIDIRDDPRRPVTKFREFVKGISTDEIDRRIDHLRPGSPRSAFSRSGGDFD